MFLRRLLGNKPQDEADDKPWEKQTDLAWVEAVNKWPWRAIGPGEWEKSAPCPYCEHEMKVERSGAWTEGPPPAVDEAPAGAIAIDQDLLYARCNCGEKHPGRPPELTRGCGRWGLITKPQPPR